MHFVQSFVYHGFSLGSDQVNLLKLRIKHQKNDRLAGLNPHFWGKKWSCKTHFLHSVQQKVMSACSDILSCPILLVKTRFQDPKQAIFLPISTSLHSVSLVRPKQPLPIASFSSCDAVLPVCHGYAVGHGPFADHS